jgi:hypothetical protein
MTTTMNAQALEELKARCQSAASAFQQLQANHTGLPHEQMEFNYAVLLALKAVYDSVIDSE